MQETPGEALAGAGLTRVYRVNELPAEIAAAIETATMNPAHDHLNDLLKE